MNAFLRRLESDQTLIADGATGTNLQQAGLAAGAHTEEWVIDRPDQILDLERAFIGAGADIILTCTFGATAIRMRGSKYDDRIEELNRTAALIAREAAGRKGDILVAGSMGPLGKLLKPYGPITRDQAADAFAEQARGLSSGGVDLLIIETQFSLDEARAAFEAAQSVCNVPVIVSFSYDQGTRTMMGLQPQVAARTFGQLGAAMIGVNCGTTLDNALAVVQDYARTEPSLPIWVKPNAGLPRLEGNITRYDVTPEQMGAFAAEAVAHGARVVGGCCGTTPEHLRAISRAAREVAK
jgi:5-methyltetrahydrofolate--homocysteine methyltransferase